MARSREVMYLDDFRGGLNLTAQQQNLATNETPDSLNMDYGVQGGMTLRGGLQAQESLKSDSWNGAKFLCASYFSDDVLLVVAGDAAGSLYEWDSSVFSDTTEDVSDHTDTENVRAASYNGKVYLANGGAARSGGTIQMFSWDGTTKTTLTNTFNDDYLAPDNGDMPLARHIAAHNNHVWVADTVESAVRYPSRLRWSHLGQPEDWATADYVDVDPFDDGDPVTALVPYRDTLLVFKRSSVWAIYGYDRTQFQLERISSAAGVNDPRAVTVSSGICYWFSTDGQLMAFNGSGVAPLTNNLAWWVDIGKIAQGGDHVLMWADGRLWISTKAGSAETVSRYMFVWDPAVKALSRYDLEIEDMFHWERLNVEHDPLFIYTSGQSNVFRYDRAYEIDRVSGFLQGVDGVFVDTVAGGYVTTLETYSLNRIEGYHVTSWQTAGETATKKRWKRPRLTAAATGNATITLDVFHDFDTTERSKRSDFLISVGEDNVWDTMDWGDSWSDGSDTVYEFSREPSSGSARAIQYKICSFDNTARWWLDSIAVPFRRKQVK